MTAAIVARGLGKQFLHRGDPGPQTLRNFIQHGWKTSRKATPFWALRNIDAAVEPGEVVGVIGRNGSGKSTFLRLIGGVMVPSAGSLTTSAPVHGLLDLNTGMHPDLSGRENVMIGGVLAGLLVHEVEDRFDDIVAFSELEAHIDDPFRTFSEGMKLRLGFSVAVHVAPRILLIDEVLAVGDAAFQDKCIQRLRNIRDEGCAIVVISHDTFQLREFCDRVIWLQDGVVAMTGNPAEVIGAYDTSLTHAMHRDSDTGRAADKTACGTILEMGTNRFGTLQAEISSVRLQTGSFDGKPALATGGPLTILADLAAKTPVHAHVSVSIADSHGVTCFESNTEVDGFEGPIALSPDRALELVFERCDLAPGEYTISLGLWTSGWETAFDFHVNAYPLRVVGSASARGPWSPPRRWRVT